MLRPRLCYTIDGEAVICRDDGVADFDLLHSQGWNGTVCLQAFDLLELNGADLRKLPLIERKAKLRRLLAKASGGIRFVEHIELDGPIVFQHACKLGLEGIVSKRRDMPYRSGRSLHMAQDKESESASGDKDSRG
jgi:bifunctional non-homologous end joining protein LigD